MTKKELWKIYVKQNPNFIKNGASINLTAKGLKKVFDTTWNVTYKQGYKNRDAEIEIPKILQGLFRKEN